MILLFFLHLYALGTAMTARRHNAIKAPSYHGLHPASPASSAAKRANKSSDTTHELALRHALWRMGLRYRKHVRSLPGVPDIVFISARVAVFCDGDYWHGRNWSALRVKLETGTNGPYWVTKIRSNMERDRNNTAQLEEAGWVVLRFWESDIKKRGQAIAEQVRDTVLQRRGGGNDSTMPTHFGSEEA